MRPGLTGLPAIRGRQSIDWETRMMLDLEYVDNWSLGLDLRILAATVPVVLLRRGVYDADGEMKERPM
jgi:lipopolysaccharide/colanic/teichoic acid biosynthesis glycosyltransferase